MNNHKYIRYIVTFQDYEIPVSYHCDLGANAYSYAVQTASRFFGKIEGERLEWGSLVRDTIKDYNRKVK